VLLSYIARLITIGELQFRWDLGLGFECGF